MNQKHRTSKTVQNILATRESKLCRLLNKVTSINPPQKHKKTIPNTLHNIGNAATRTTTK